ncbi:TerC/Alx family metal homeostasis membrane protein [Chromohalobacter salexigens]|uniref:TerC/Alx family metal homeostasis membrane protein n=1 Tax=Chromohalobacter moromii TaxID=2860329 RepID=A0A9X2X068_9GAMM|nr:MULTISPECIES: TerC/Alx family metal homeostasis membrane protein [Chromohalobacter]NWO10848.1 TerC/Alx family metal homeostasis membrane protein [Chromohalobacter salexigens]MCK2041638.1 TerC/Alx family metal homeostasis membrane protein [Chromohalobacter moromii]MCK2044575.1 TerC/Alx family metal homeostasis membrane protein [Chromohalobacter moromii]MCT8504271.1 TerC/Alx family metal homeostasis membrane protein [Chromohalobacter moromii]MCT8513786.1 TerC/Alx family metal homeostasis memb
MHVPLWVWLATVAGIIALFVFDFFSHVRKPHAPSFKESAAWSCVYIALAMVFGAGLWLVWGPQHGAEYFAGFITEKSLSVDNLFVFVIIMSKFAVPRIHQQKALLIGIVIALIMRGIFIAVGAAAIHQFSWVFYIFGAFLLWTAYKLGKESFEEHDEEEEYRPNLAVRLAQRWLPVTEEYHGQRLIAKIGGKRLVTPLFMVIVALGFTDLLFALDSIPAIYGLTREPYIVFTANAFALLGLLQLYFLLGGLLSRLVYLGLGLSVILGFIGVKLVMEALHENTLPFINGGHPIESIPEIPIWLSMTIIVGALVSTGVASLIKDRRDRARA